MLTAVLYTAFTLHNIKHLDVSVTLANMYHTLTSLRVPLLL